MSSESVNVQKFERSSSYFRAKNTLLNGSMWIDALIQNPGIKIRISIFCILPAIGTVMHMGIKVIEVTIKFLSKVIYCREVPLPS